MKSSKQSHDNNYHDKSDMLNYSIDVTGPYTVCEMCEREISFKPGMI